MSSFENLRIVDNFYQTSLFFPMPTVVISTLCEDGSTTLGPYSLVQPYYVAGKDFYAMLLSCRNSSNTAQNILRTGKCCINFVDDKPKTFAECVKLSWPGDKPEDKMPNCKFRLEKSQVEEATGEKRPMVLTDAIQAIECTWVRELDNAQNDQPGELNGYEGPYHDVEDSLAEIEHLQNSYEAAQKIELLNGGFLKEKLQELLPRDSKYVVYGDTDSCIESTLINTSKGKTQIGEFYNSTDSKEIEYKSGKFFKEVKEEIVHC